VIGTLIPLVKTARWGDVRQRDWDVGISDGIEDPAYVGVVKAIRTGSARLPRIGSITDTAFGFGWTKNNTATSSLSAIRPIAAIVTEILALIRRDEDDPVASKARGDRVESGCERCNHCDAVQCSASITVLPVAWIVSLATVSCRRSFAAVFVGAKRGAAISAAMRQFTSFVQGW